MVNKKAIAVAFFFVSKSVCDIKLLFFTLNLFLLKR